MPNIDLPKSNDLQDRINAIEIVVRSVLASLPLEHLNKVEHLSHITLNKLKEDQSLSPDNRRHLANIADIVRFLFAHSSNQGD